MIITLDVFSGRPNPSWKLSPQNAKAFLERFANKSVADANEVDNVLGYRGVIVSASSDEQLPDNMLSEFRVGGNSTASAGSDAEAKIGLSADESDDAVLWLLSKGQHAVNEDVLAYVHDTIEMRKSGIGDTHPTEMDENKTEQPEQAVAAPCVIQNTAYNPAFWNTAAAQPKNNCYNYAMNYKSDTFAQPGRITGHQYVAPPTCAKVSAAAAWDGCKITCNGPSKNVALVIWPNVDYHWYRRHSEGFWGHKPGGTAARNIDNSNIIINGTTRKPDNCNRGPYTIFCGYYYSPTGMMVK